jgi:hypothetical protein
LGWDRLGWPFLVEIFPSWKFFSFNFLSVIIPSIHETMENFGLTHETRELVKKENSAPEFLKCLFLNVLNSRNFFENWNKTEL